MMVFLMICLFSQGLVSRLEFDIGFVTGRSYRLEEIPFPVHLILPLHKWVGTGQSMKLENSLCLPEVRSLTEKPCSLIKKT